MISSVLGLAAALAALGAAPALAQPLVHGGGWSTPTIVDPQLVAQSVSCASPSFCLAVSGNGYSSEYVNGGWSAPSSIGKNLGDATNSTGIQSVSCPTAIFCVAADAIPRGGGGVLRYDGHAWSRLAVIDPGGRVLAGVSCPSRSFCAAVDARGRTLVFKRGRWSAPVQVMRRGDGLSSVSCVSASFCVAIDYGSQFVVYDGRTWSQPGTVGGGGAQLDALACASPTFCMATSVAQTQTASGYSGENSTLFRFHGRKWTRAGFDGGGGITSVSCASASLCLATDDNGKLLVYDGTSWSARGHSGETAVSCTRPAFCAVVGNGIGATFAHGVLGAHVPIGSGGAPDGISCATASYCMLVDSGGDAVSYNGRAWSRPVHFADTHGGPQGVSCVSPSFCAAVDGDGNGWTYDGSSWSTPTTIAAVNGDDAGGAVSCVSSSFCEATTGNGYASTFANGKWSGAGALATGQYAASISCVSTSFCLEADGNSFYTFNGTHWQMGPDALGPGAIAPWSVSCVSSSFCGVVESGGTVGTYDGHRFRFVSKQLDSSTSDGGSSDNTFAVSCGAVTLCAAVDGYGFASIYNGQSWSRPAKIDPNNGGLTAVSCPSATICVAVDGRGQALTYRGG